MMSNVIREKMLGYLSSFYDKNGYSPSYREIADALGVRSTSTVHKYIHILQSEGLLDTDRQRSRAVSLNRHVDIDTSGSNVQRIKLRAADGGMLLFDCSTEKNSNGISLNFGGIMDATLMKGNVSRIVSCSVDTGD